MKILHVTPSYYPAFKYGGPINSTHLVNKKLVDKNIDVTVFTTSDGQSADTQLNTKNSVDNIKVYYYKSYGNTGYGISFRLLFSLLKNIRNYDVVLITSVFTFVSLITPIVCKIFKKPYIFSSRGTLDPENVKSKSSFIKNMSLKLYERNFLNTASSIIVLTEDEKNWLSELSIYNNNIQIIPNGMDIHKDDDFNKINFINQKSIKLIYFGRLNFKKNIDFIIKSYAEIIKIHKNISLFIAGPDDGLEKDLKELAVKLGLENKINFLGLLSGKDKDDFLKSSDIFILPSLSEGISMAQLEAMKNKCAVVVGNRGGIHYDLINTNSGIVIDPSVQSLTEALLKLIGNDEERRKIAENGFNLVKTRYSWDSIINNYIDLYESLNEELKEIQYSKKVKS